MNNLRLSDFFNLRDFECPCCHKVMISEILYQKLYRLRLNINKPIIINSGYRCTSYNTKVGGEEHSYHMLGLAVDISVPTIILLDLYNAAKEINFTGIGFYEKRGFLHLDVRPGKLSEW